MEGGRGVPLCKELEPYWRWAEEDKGKTVAVCICGSFGVGEPLEWGKGGKGKG